MEIIAQAREQVKLCETPEQAVQQLQFFTSNVLQFLIL